MPNEQVKAFISNIVASATWDAIKRGVGCSLVTGIATALWEKLKHGSLDWYAIGGMFALTLIVALSFFRKQSLRDRTFAICRDLELFLAKHGKRPSSDAHAWDNKFQEDYWRNYKDKIVSLRNELALKPLTCDALDKRLAEAQSLALGEVTVLEIDRNLRLLAAKL